MGWCFSLIISSPLYPVFYKRCKDLLLHVNYILLHYAVKACFYIYTLLPECPCVFLSCLHLFFVSFLRFYTVARTSFSTAFFFLTPLFLVCLYISFKFLVLLYLVNHAWFFSVSEKLEDRNQRK